MHAAGVDPKDMVDMIGHENDTITREVYIHQNIETLRKCIEVLD